MIMCGTAKTAFWSIFIVYSLQSWHVRRSPLERTVGGGDVVWQWYDIGAPINEQETRRKGGVMDQVEE